MEALRRHFTRSIVVLLIGSGLAVTSSPVLAAQAQNVVDVSVCVEFSNGAPYSLRPLYLYNRLGNEVRNGQTNGTGCGTFYDVPANSYYTFESSWDLVWANQNWVFWGTSLMQQAGDSSRADEWIWTPFVVEPYFVS